MNLRCRSALIGAALVSVSTGFCSAVLAADAHRPFDDVRRLGAAQRTVTVEVDPEAGGAPLTLNLERFTVTTGATRFVRGVPGGADEPIDFDPTSVALFRGAVDGHPGSRAFLAVGRRGPVGTVHLGDGQGPFMLGAGAEPGAPMVLRRAAGRGSLPPGLRLCGVDDPPAGSGGAAAAAVAGGPGTERTKIIELAIETDYEFFQLLGDLDAAAAYVVQLYGAVSDIYMQDVDARFVLTFVRLWDMPDDLFNEPNPLGPFRTYWNANMAEHPRDIAQLLSGRRDLPYGGAAYLSALCGDAGYSVVGYVLGFFPDPAEASVWHYDVGVTAHELGHNCGAQHTHWYGLDTCDDLDGVPQRGTVMSYCSQTVSGGNACTDLRLHTVVQDAIRTHLADVACLTPDCNGNGVDDAEEIAGGFAADTNGNGVPDECEDCNGNGAIDLFDIAIGNSADLNTNGIPDECEPDCNGNSRPDDLDIADGTSLDLYGDGVPDECETDCNGDGVSDYTEIQQDLGLDIDRNVRLDACQDCDGDGVPDLEDLGAAYRCWVTGNAGDGALRGFHPITGVLAAATAPAQLADGQDLVIDAAGFIYVSSGLENRVARFDSAGAGLGDFVAPGSGGLQAPAGMVFAADGSLLVASRGTDAVIRYDGTTGAPLGDFVAPGAGGLTGPFGLVFGPDGNLHVTSNDGRVLVYDGATGAPLGELVTVADNGGLTEPRGLCFLPGGNLIVASHASNSVLEYDGGTGAFVGKFNRGGTDEALTLDGPWTLRLGPDGHVYVSRSLVGSADPGGGDPDHLHINSTRIYIFDEDSGNFLRSYVTGNDTGLVTPTGFDFMPDFGVDCNRNLVADDCEIASGQVPDADGNGIPDPCECPADVNGDGTVDVDDLTAIVLGWGACPAPPAPCAADVTNDGTVDVDDLTAVILGWGGCGE